MAKYLINEAAAGSGFDQLPNTNVRVEATEYLEEGSFTKFFDAEGVNVFSIKTESVKTIRTEQ